ncbi:MAG: thioredoxin [Bacteroidota bacterium]
MKTPKIIIFLFLLTSLAACSSSSSKEASGDGTTIQLTKSAFISDVFDYEKNKEWKYQGDMPCIIDFYADWCRPCKMVSPIMEELATKYKGKIKIYKVNTDKEPDLSRAFNISSIPAVFFIPMAGEPQMNVGAMAKEDYEKVINDFLLKSNTKQ